MNSIALTRPIVRNTVVDIGVFIAIYFIPAMSHLVSFPLYILEPMRVFLFIGYLLSKSTPNALFLAFTIPLFSLATTGHPVFYKATLISVELVINIYLLHRLVNYANFPVFVSLALATVVSKIGYYVAKYIFIKLALLNGTLISTNPLLQLVTLLSLSAIFALFFKKGNPKL